MHDPMTVAFEIRSPFRHAPTLLFPEGYRNPILTVWHVDPETDGSDDSCGFGRPRLTEEQRGRIQALAWTEAYTPHFQKKAVKRLTADEIMEAMTLTTGAIVAVATILDIPATSEEVFFLANRLANSPGDNILSMLCFLPGWHSNSPVDRRSDREDHARALFSTIATCLLRGRRPWWRHPRWHIWHWKIQIHPLDALKRWLFTRCAKCGRRFRGGEAVISNAWHSDGPRWFRSEKEVYHIQCTPGGENTVLAE